MSSLATQEASQASPLGALLQLSEYQQHRSHIFPSVESVRWYLRGHRTALENAGALLYIAGRLWIAPAPFDAYVIEDGRRAAKARSAEGTAA